MSQAGPRTERPGSAQETGLSLPGGTLDALAPPDIARKAETVGVAKAELGLTNTFVLGVLAGAFIALGAVFATAVTTTGTGELSWGLTRLLGGLAFSLGLVLVVVAGAELFTGNNLIVMAWASRRVRTAGLLRNWAIVYIGNFVGALATAGLMYVTKQYTFAGGAVGGQALSIAAAKTDYGFVQALALGALCNALVCLAVWLTYSARSTTDKILAIIPPITAFVASGFEHSVANMYFIPLGLLIETDTSWANATPGLPDTSGLSWGSFFADNLLPVTLGNIGGGAMMVAAVYWFVYLRPQRTERAQ